MATETDPKARLKSYISLFSHALKVDNKMCLCGVLASENDALPEALQLESKIFFEKNIAWLKEGVFSKSQKA